VEETAADELLPAELRREDDLEGVPELSEPDVVRHFTRISTWNYNIDLGLYPLGSCTMKYNSRLNEKVARIPGFAALHPLAPEEDAQGALQVMYELQHHLAEITGLPGVSLQPAAGAHGELTGVMMIRAALDARDGTSSDEAKRRKVMLIPDSAHGTNPASAHLSGFTVKTIRSTSEGLTDLEHLRELCAAGDVAEPEHVRHLRAQHQRDLRHRPRGGRARLHGRGEHERARRRRAPGRHGRRCHPPQPAQDFFHSARRRRPRLRPLLLYRGA
jgi:glycine dehydrogenase subunit 2